MTGRLFRLVLPNLPSFLCRDTVAGRRICDMATSRGNSDDHREIIRERLALALGNESTADHDELHSRATGIEHALSDSLRPGSKEYMSKARSLVCNLKGNAGLRQRVLSGEVHPSALVAASAQELASDDLKVRRRQSAELILSLSLTLALALALTLSRYGGSRVRSDSCPPARWAARATGSSAGRRG